MPRTCDFDQQALAGLLSRPDRVIGCEQALNSGLTEKAVRYRLREGGLWQRLLPGVYLTHTGSPSADQREIGALRYARPDSVLTGAAALRRFGLGPRTDLVDALVPAATQKRDAGFVHILRTARLPEPVGVAGGVWFAFPPAPWPTPHAA